MKRRRATGTNAVLQCLRLDRSLMQAMAGLYALLAVFIGFAHGPVGLVSTDGIHFASQPGYERQGLPDGGDPDICSVSDQSGSAHGKAGGHGCDACRVTSAPGLGAIASLVLGPLGTGLANGNARKASPIFGQFIADPTARGPPPIMPVA